MDSNSSNLGKQTSADKLKGFYPHCYIDCVWSTIENPQFNSIF